VLRSRLTKPYDDDWPLLVGEIVSQAREALDHLIQQLAIEHRGTAGSGHAFPIYKTKGRFKADKIRGIHPRWQNEIRSLHPYNCTPPESSPLVRLNAITQSSKHHDVLVTAIGLGMPAPEFEMAVKCVNSIAITSIRLVASNWLGQPIDGALIQGIITEPFDPGLRMEFNGGLPMTITFGEGQEAVGDLRDLIRIVRKIITGFEPAFRKPRI
jgi:hypothetical protein